MALTLSWYNTVSPISYSCDFNKFTSQIICGPYSLTPTTFNSVILLVFSFCFDDFLWTIPHLNDIAPMVRPCMFICNACATYIHVLNFLKSLVPIIILSFMVALWKLKTLLSLCQSSSVAYCILLQRKYITVSRSGLDLSIIHKRLCTDILTTILSVLV